MQVEADISPIITTECSYKLRYNLYLCSNNHKCKRMKYLYILLFMAVANVCNAQSSQDEGKKATAPRTFEMISIPSSIKEPEKRAEYLAKHYWDKFDFRDTTYIHEPTVTEQALSNYIDLMKYVSPETMSASTKELMRQAEQDRTMFHYFSEMMEIYLYDSYSPFRNEEMYIAVLEYLVESSSLNETDKIRPKQLLELVRKNRIGTPATDFTYTMANGQTSTLHKIQTDYLLLFFYDPDCQTCQEISKQMSTSFLINDFLKDKRLTILAVYPDEDLLAWKEHIATLPANWINSYDASGSLRNEEIYDLKATPTLYLLNKEKTVLLKDATFPEIEKYLSQTH